MIEDYRSTKYCPRLTELVDAKESVKDAVLAKHRGARDMYRYISKNDFPFKCLFVQAYKGKCAYCGVSIKIIPWKMFEIDHFIPKDSPRFGGKKAKAGYIENLVLSCYDCNRAKSSLELPDADHYKLHPDDVQITHSFIRDDKYYIRVSEDMKSDNSVNKFYTQLRLDSQIHRIDYLLLSMRGLCEKITDEHPAYAGLTKAIDLLQQKRNMMHI